MRMLTQHGYSAAQRTDRFSKVYPSLCRDWTFIQSGLGLQCLHRKEGIKYVLSVEVWVILKMIVLGIEVPSGQSVYAPGVCPQCRKGNHWARVCKSKPDIMGCLLPGNERRGQPQAPKYPRQAVYGAIKQLPSQRNPFLNLSGEPQEVKDWTSVPPPTQY